MNTRKLFGLRAVALALGLGALGGPQAWASAADAADAPGWYATLSAGAKLGSGSSDTRVDMSGPPVPISLSGQTQWGHGPVVSVAVGRQMRSEGNDAADDKQLLRLEGEWWHGRVQRQSVRVAALNANTSDSMTANALFLNGLVRVASTENTRWWVGAGVGIARAELPDASSIAASCGCLGAASGNGAAFRLKAQAERWLSESTAVFAELGYVRLPGISTSGSGFPQTHYDGVGVTHLSVGLRTRF